MSEIKVTVLPKSRNVEDELFLQGLKRSRGSKIQAEETSQEHPVQKSVEDTNENIPTRAEGQGSGKLKFMQLE